MIINSLYSSIFELKNHHSFASRSRRVDRFHADSDPPSSPPSHSLSLPLVQQQLQLQLQSSYSGIRILHRSSICISSLRFSVRRCSAARNQRALRGCALHRAPPFPNRERETRKHLGKTSNDVAEARRAGKLRTFFL